MDLEHERRLADVESRSKSNSHRLEAVERNQKALDSIATSVAVMAEKQKNISDKVDTIDEKVDTLERKPGKRWDGLVDKLLLVAGTAILTWLLAQAGVVV